MPYKNLIILACIALIGFIAPVKAQNSKALKETIEAPDFSAETIDGRQFELSGQRGKVTLVVFWATWCSYCRKELPLIEQQLWQEMKNDPDFSLITISEAAPEKLRAFMKKGRYSFPAISDPSGEITSLFVTKGIPAHFVIDANGEVKNYYQGFSLRAFAMLRNSIQSEIAELKQIKAGQASQAAALKPSPKQPAVSYDFLKTEMRPAARKP